jgi:CDP-diacylglycerol---glycerol-3-phosphate 3-phosphatidyltransferase
MLERLRHLQGHVMRPVAQLLVRLGVSPDAVTWFGATSVTVVALVCFPQGWLWQGAVLVALLSASDMVDGHMARALPNRDRRWGSFLDSSLDRLADAGIIGALAWYLALHRDPLWAVLAVAALVAAQLTSYVRARAEAVGCTAESGIVTRADRVALVVVGAFLAGVGVPYALEAAVVLLAAGGAVTVAQRLAEVRHQLR